MKWYANPQPRKKILTHLEHINTLMTDEAMDVNELTQEEHVRRTGIQGTQETAIVTGWAEKRNARSCENQVSQSLPKF